jgi:hypothetical protein
VAAQNVFLLVALVAQGLSWAYLGSLMDANVRLGRFAPTLLGVYVAFGVWWAVRRRVSVAEAKIAAVLSAVGLVAILGLP